MRAAGSYEGERREEDFMHGPYADGAGGACEIVAVDEEANSPDNIRMMLEDGQSMVDYPVHSCSPSSLCGPHPASPADAEVLRGD